MIETTTYPKILIVVQGRINELDTTNNGLFIRNLLGQDWPREKLAQIYSSGDVGDRGFFGHYYCLSSKDRFMGSFFYRVKHNDVVRAEGFEPSIKSTGSPLKILIRKMINRVASLVVSTGLYELIFRPRLSDELSDWVDNFKPDIIFAQGYNLTFCWLPLMLKKKTGAKLCVLTTDDWPKYQYAGMHGESTVFKKLVRPYVERTAMKFFSEADYPFAFGMLMAEEYKKRYARNFAVINHSDDEERFLSAKPVRLQCSNIKNIIAIGTFNKFRYPLLLDLAEACKSLVGKGIAARISVLSSAIDSDGHQLLANCDCIDIMPDPGNDLLPSYLKGGDALFLAEGFDEEFVSAIELSISTKAHLFMFSRRPIIVYAGKKAGVTQYADRFGWAKVISERNVSLLAGAIEAVLSDSEEAKRLIKKAEWVANSFHTHSSNRSIFLSRLQGEK